MNNKITTATSIFLLLVFSVLTGCPLEDSTQTPVNSRPTCKKFDERIQKPHVRIALSGEFTGQGEDRGFFKVLMVRFKAELDALVAPEATLDWVSENATVTLFSLRIGSRFEIARVVSELSKFNASINCQVPSDLELGGAPGCLDGEPIRKQEFLLALHGWDRLNGPKVIGGLPVYWLIFDTVSGEILFDRSDLDKLAQKIKEVARLSRSSVAEPQVCLN